MTGKAFPEIAYMGGQFAFNEGTKEDWGGFGNSSLVPGKDGWDIKIQMLVSSAIWLEHLRSENSRQ